MQKEIIDGVKDRIIECLNFGSKYLCVYLLILRVDLLFSQKRTVSYVAPGLLDYKIVFSLGNILNLHLTNKEEWFYEKHKRTNCFSGIESFCGDWWLHLQALVCHEMAHVFESVARLEPYSKSRINEFYNIKPSNKRTKHHNLLWRLIYKDLRMLKNNEVDQSIIVIPKEKGFDLFYKKGEYYEV